MRFFHTHGKDAKYLISLYNWNLEDHHYYDTFAEARKAFNKFVDGDTLEKDTVVSMYDLKKDVRKAFVRVQKNY